MIRLIAAIDRERGIAKSNCIPWKILSDERYFTSETKKYGGINLVGRVTFETFKRPLVERQNFVLTHSTRPILGVEIVNDLGAFLKAHSKKDIWVVGGASVFEQTIAHADELYLTPIDALFGCDRFFPAYENEFTLDRYSKKQEENEFCFRYEIWRSKS